MWNFVDDHIKNVGSNDFKKLRRLLMRNDHFRSFTLKSYFSIILPLVKYGIIFNMGFVCNFSSVEQPKKMPILSKDTASSYSEAINVAGWDTISLD